MGVWVAHYVSDSLDNIDTLRRGDLYECPTCKTKMVTDFGRAMTIYTHSSGVEGFNKLVEAVLSQEHFVYRGA